MVGEVIHHGDFEVKFSELFDGQSVVALCAWKPKMTYAEILNVILNERGYVDAAGIVHKAD